MTITRCCETGVSHRKAAVNNECGSTGSCHRHLPFLIYFLFGRCVSADPAALFAALLLLGSRRTFAAALAAFLLVTSRFALRLAIAALPLELRARRH
ncbi:hypothetical protein [Agrobacterium fabrum]|uniref:hypothetical protein n=1 Tax=Agrobacterium fabrum TaxID=1176649 RepID=UPI0016476016|nr:hypothetical protein [Agrobacterium fabrum]